MGSQRILLPIWYVKRLEKKVDLIITHHDAWDFVFGMKKECHNPMKQFKISHYFVQKMILSIDDDKNLIPFPTEIRRSAEGVGTRKNRYFCLEICLIYTLYELLSSKKH
ncbi:hypothetical protein [Paenibacillus sp. yr247]|uniref:hypothetical protein n=1 Tax=Paenibacillus sp. yr247 TaxID=1761880 RepID=UPI000B8499B7|nr:hypothetical protein [Paenibacillus sp. yr247]